MKRKEFRPETDPSVVVLLIIGIFCCCFGRKKMETRERERAIQILEKPFGLGVVWCGAER